MSFDTHFIANVKLKDIIGRGLINDPNLAIIELVKNAKDAGSSMVEIEFYNTDSRLLDDSHIIIRDAGVGMSRSDIQNKWLNIAYSEKSQIRNQGLAGNKGIGRFSCDSLGVVLKLYTKSKNDKLGSSLSINWKLFEVNDQNKEISEIPLTIFDGNKFNINENIESSGTILQIEQLRMSWGKNEIKSLISALEKFSLDPNKPFDIYVKYKFSTENEYKKIKVENKIFELLDLKTTSIESKISQDAKSNQFILQTTLRHAGNMIIKITEQNPYNNLNMPITLKIFYLNVENKRLFARKTNYKSQKFGSIFLFLNGFRVLPYGEENNDWLQIDQRAAQGYNRYLSTRNLVGYVEISDAENSFSPVSSREGLFRNEAFYELVSENLTNTLEGSVLRNNGYIWRSLRKLEKFVVGGVNWDNVDKYSDNTTNIPDVLLPIIGRETSLDAQIEINEAYLLELSNEAKEKYKQAIKKISSKYGNLNLNEIASSNFSSINSLLEEQGKKIQHAKVEIEKKARENQELKEKLSDSKKKSEIISAENLFLRSDKNQDKDELKNLHHQIIVQSDAITRATKNFSKKIRQLELSSKSLSIINEYIGKIETTNQKILQYSSFATTGNYRLTANTVSVEFTSFISKYLDRLNTLKIHDDIEIVDSLDVLITHEIKLRPLAITIVVDNLISNAKKAGASKIYFSNSESSWLIISNDGDPLNEQYADSPQRIFDKGTTSTNGSGLGLFHVHETLEETGLNIRYIQDSIFTLEITK